jgi:hypothetical protein
MIRNDPCPFVSSPALLALREAILCLQRVQARSKKV